MLFLKVLFLSTAVSTSSMAVLLLLMVAPQEVAAARAFFVFGDSLVDSGNNNFLPTTARADYPPYGIDLPPNHRPTGRFSDGLNFPDVICMSLGLQAPLPYLDPNLREDKLLLGANFASAGIGILNDTGLQFVRLKFCIYIHVHMNILNIPDQLRYFMEYQQRLSKIIAPADAERLVNEAFFLISLGGNDFVNNYFLTPFAPRRRQFALPQYCTYLISEYRTILQRLYELGARRVMVTGTGPLGCVPGEMALSGGPDGKCVQEPQRASAIYNALLTRTIQDLNAQLGSDIFIASNAFDYGYNFIKNPSKFGFEPTRSACCGQGPYNGLGTCNPLSFLCPNRSARVFWDAFHPTERAIRIIVKQMMIGPTKYMNPMNLTTVMAVDSKP